VSILFLSFVEINCKWQSDKMADGTRGNEGGLGCCDFVTMEPVISCSSCTLKFHHGCIQKSRSERPGGLNLALIGFVRNVRTRYLICQ